MPWRVFIHIDVNSLEINYRSLISFNWPFSAIFNFKEKGKLCLELQVGEAVYIIKESGDWYFGCAANHRDRNGIFPKSYVQIRESSIDKTG